MTATGMPTIVLHKRKRVYRANSTVMRVQTDLYRQLEALSDETGLASCRIANILLTEALKHVEVRD